MPISLIIVLISLVGISGKALQLWGLYNQGGHNMMAAEEELEIIEVITVDTKGMLESIADYQTLEASNHM